jgi:hypothetical protein
MEAGITRVAESRLNRTRRGSRSAKVEIATTAFRLHFRLDRAHWNLRSSGGPNPDLPKLDALDDTAVAHDRPHYGMGIDSSHGRVGMHLVVSGELILVGVFGSASVETSSESTAPATLAVSRIALASRPLVRRPRSIEAPTGEGG